MPFRLHKSGITVNVRLTPGARKDGIAGVVDAGDGKKALKIAVRSPPEDGKANEALCTLIADTLNVPTSRVRLTAGAKSRVKQIAVTGDPSELIARLEASRA